MRLIFLCVFLFAGAATHAQIWLTGGVDVHQYAHSKSLMIKEQPVFATLRFGFDIYKPDNGRFEFGGEIGPIGRRFKRELGGDTYLYKFPGLQALVEVQFNLTEKIYLNGGLAGAAFWDELRRNATRKKIASGFRSEDVGVAVGAGVKLSDRFSAGYRYTHWLLDMLEYRVISDFGAIGPQQTDIRASNHLIYLRFYLLEKQE